MTIPPAFTHGLEHANPAMKARFKSSCEGLGLRVCGQRRNSRAGSSIGSIRGAGAMLSQFARYEGVV